MVAHSLDVDIASFLYHRRHSQLTLGSPLNSGNDLMQLRAYGHQRLENKDGKDGLAMQFRFEILPIPAGGSLGLNSRMVLVMGVETFAKAQVETRRARLDRVHYWYCEVWVYYVG